MIKIETAIKNNRSSNTPFNLELHWVSFEPRRQTIRGRGGEISIGESSSHRYITSSGPQTPAHYSTAIKNNLSSNTPFDLELHWVSFAPRRQTIRDQGGEISISESSSHGYITSSGPQAPTHYSTAIKNNLSHNTPFDPELDRASFELELYLIVALLGDLHVAFDYERSAVVMVVFLFPG